MLKLTVKFFPMPLANKGCMGSLICSSVCIFASKLTVFILYVWFFEHEVGKDYFCPQKPSSAPVTTYFFLFDCEVWFVGVQGTLSLHAWSFAWHINHESYHQH